MEFPRVTTQRREFLERATSTYAESLAESAAATGYLAARGIAGEVAAHFRLGFVAEPLEGHDWMVGTLSIPYITPSGVSAIRFRRLDDEGSKYTQETASYTPLFNVRDLHRNESYIAVCEGEFDTIVMSALCGVPAVGIGGVDQWTTNGNVYRRLLEDYERVFVVMDPDESGQRMAKAIAKTVTDPTNVVLTYDVNDTYVRQGPALIRAALGLE